MIFAERTGKWKEGRRTTLTPIIWALGLFLMLWGRPALAQISTGSEQITNISSGQANLGTNLPAQNYSLSTGLNTFIVPSVPTNAAIRIQITNETANVCAGAFQVTVWTTLERQVSSFNNNLQVWQLVPMISPVTGAYVSNTGLLTLGSLQTTLLTTAAVAGNTVAIQVVNTTGGCSTTNIDVIATFVSTAITSPLITVASNGSIQTGGNANQVQGVIAQQVNGQLVNPVIEGGLQLPVNSGFTAVGIDNFSSGIGGNGAINTPSQACVTPNACTGATAIAPAPAKVGEFAVAFESTNGSSGTGNPNCPPGAVGCVLPPWTATGGSGVSCAGASPFACISTLSNIVSGQPIVQGLGQSTLTGFNLGAIVETTATALRQSVAASGAAVSLTSSTLANSTLIAAFGCATTSPCTVSSVADTQGLTWKQLLSQPGFSGFQQSGLSVWAATTLTATAAADTITATLGSGSAQSAMAVELTGTTPTQLTAPSISAEFDPIGRQVEAVDAQAPNQFNCTVTLSTNTTTQCQAAPTTINGVAVRLYVTDFQINTTTAGTATTIQLKTGTGANCATGTANLSAITYANTAIGLNSVLGTRTPLIPPLQSAVCATQAGTTAGTSVVEIRGFLAP